jgi:hypothetical protein
MGTSIVWRKNFVEAELVVVPSTLEALEKAGCAYRKSNPAILMVQSAQDRMADNASGCLGGA